MWKAFGSKAPGIAWVGQWFVPIGQGFGSIELGLLLSIIIVQFGTLLLMYELGKEFLPGGGFALLGCLLLVSAPLFVGMSHQYVVEPLQLFAVTYLYWIAVRSYSWRGPQVMGHLFLASGLGLASKVTFPLYCFIPGCIALYNAGKGTGPRDQYSSGDFWKFALLVLGGIAVLGNVLIWYARNGHILIDFVKLASSSDVALYYGSREGFFSKLQYWLGALQESFVLPSILLAVAVVLFLAACIRLANSERRRTVPPMRLSVLAAGALAHVGLVLIIFSLNVNEEQRYLLPLLPSMVVIFLWGFSFVKMPLVLVLAAFLFTGQWVYVESRAFGFVPSDDRMSHWVLPLQSSREKMNELNRIIELTCTPRTAGRYSIIGVELPWLNYNSMSFYAVKWKQDTHLSCFYVSLGYAETDPAKAWKRVYDLNIEYFISLEETAIPSSPDVLNQISLAILQQVQADPRFTRVPYLSNFKVVVFQKHRNSESDSLTLLLAADE